VKCTPRSFFAPPFSDICPLPFFTPPSLPPSLPPSVPAVLPAPAAGHGGHAPDQRTEAIRRSGSQRGQGGRSGGRKGWRRLGRGGGACRHGRQFPVGGIEGGKKGGKGRFASNVGKIEKRPQCCASLSSLLPSLPPYLCERRHHQVSPERFLGESMRDSPPLPPVVPGQRQGDTTPTQAKYEGGGREVHHHLVPPIIIGL
jgi:hypothetical protein